MNGGTLTEDDVPGAKLVHVTVDEHTNIQLQRWLMCRGLTTAGKRCDLIIRCKTALKAKVQIDPKIDGGKWYDLKCKENKSRTGSKQSTKPILPITGWKKFPSASLPKHFNYGHIYHYLVESITAVKKDVTNTTGSSDSDNEDDLHTSKPLTKGKNLFRSGHVKCMKDANTNEFYFVKSHVQASYTQTTYNTTLTISKNSGMVKEGTCTCSASGLGRCAHVASLLFAIEDFISKFGYDPLTCTQKLCEWNKGRRKDKNPSAVFDIKYPSMKKELKQQRSAADFVMNADPRPTSLRSDNISHCAINAFLVNLQFANSSDCGWTNLLEFKYEDFTVSEYGGDVLKYQCNQFQETLEKACGNEREPFCVERTEQQAASLEWQSNRWCRITASIAKSVVCVKTGMKGILQNHLWTADDIHTAALQYGKENEGSALKAYADENPTLVVQSTGLWINPKYPQLAASPDGIVTDSVSGDDGLVEIKCPYVLRNTHPSKSKETLSTKQSNNFFCTCMDDGSLKLNKSHAYYYQIQMQLHVTEKSFCDFVVWSSKGISVERIFQDNTMWKYIYPKLQTFHKEYLVPEFFLKRIPRELQPLKFS